MRTASFIKKTKQKNNSLIGKNLTWFKPGDEPFGWAQSAEKQSCNEQGDLVADKIERALPQFIYTYHPYFSDTKLVEIQQSKNLGPYTKVGSHLILLCKSFQPPSEAANYQMSHFCP